MKCLKNFIKFSFNFSSCHSNIALGMYGSKDNNKKKKCEYIANPRDMP